PTTNVVPVKYLVGATQLSVGATFACALLTNKTVKCWGDNSAGQLGIGSSLMMLGTPYTVVGLSNVTAMRAPAITRAPRLVPARGCAGVAPNTASSETAAR